jgi:citrate lyase subunit beta / citryl-CoA lyase
MWREANMKMNLRRTVLYVPGDSEKMLHKSITFDADTLLLNLEDGVSSSMKEQSRVNIAKALKEVDFSDYETIVRVNSPASEIGKRDLEEIVPLCPDGVCLPKIENASEILAAEKIVEELESSSGMIPGSVKFHAMIESAAGILHAAEIASSSKRMASLIFGSADYEADVRCKPGEDRSEIALALQMLVLAARSAGIDAIDAPCFDTRNSDLLKRESIQARRIGFDGKSVLHPNQLELINHIFDVTPEEVAWAEKVIQELDEAEKRGKALTTNDGGQLFDNPHRIAAERILGRKKPN